MNVVLVGCGAMSKAWLDAAREVPEIAVVGLVDLDADRAETRAREYALNGVAIGTNLDAVLDQTKPHAVFDVVVPAARREVAFSALSHHCHLLTEKPLADSPDNARAIVERARQAGRVHAVVQNRRYVANVRRIRRFLDSGAIGAPTSIHADFFVAPHFGGFREEMRARAAARHGDPHVSTRRATWSTAIRNASSASNGSPPIPGTPRARRRRPCSSSVAARCSPTAAAGAPMVSAAAGKPAGASSGRAAASSGTVSTDLRAEAARPDREGLFDRLDPIEVPPLDESDRIGGHLGVIRDFVRAVESGTEPETRGADNIKSLGMVFAAIESAETGRRVDIASQDA